MDKKIEKMIRESLKQRVLALKREKNALILAHYYQTPDILEIADFVGDSFEIQYAGGEPKGRALI